MRTRRACALLTLLVLLFVPTLADPPANIDDYPFYVLIVHIIEDPDPIPQITGPSIPDVQYVPFDEDGSGRHNPLASMQFSADEMWPLAVTSNNDAADSDIGFYEWNGLSWEQATFQANGPFDELAPRGYAESSGVLHVVYWVDGPVPVVRYISGTSQACHWGQAESVTRQGQSGGRPTVAAWQGQVFVGYERPTTGAGQEIVVANRLTRGVFDELVLAHSNSADSAGVVIHVEDGQMWVDWTQSEDQLGYSIYLDGMWGTPQAVPLPDDSGESVEGARSIIRELVLGIPR